MCMVGAPESSFSFWASKFLAKECKVGKVEQVGTASGAEMRVAASKEKGTKTAERGLVRRVLNKVFTNGTLVDGDFWWMRKPATVFPFGYVTQKS